MEYLECIDFVSKWYSENFLDLNVSETKENNNLGFQKLPIQKQQILINCIKVEICDEYKYLGLIVDNESNPVFQSM